MPAVPVRRAEPRAVVRLDGGFGNQLFQWAAARLLEREHGMTVVIDARANARPGQRGDQLGPLGLHDWPTRTQGAVWRGLQRTVPTRFFDPLTARTWGLPWRVARTLAEAEDLARRGRPLVLHGFLQQPADVARLVEVDQDSLVALRDAMAGRSPLEGQAYAAVHVRRGDYVSHPEYSRSFGVCSEEYYLRALERLRSPRLVIVTDDPVWGEDFARRARPGGGVEVVSESLASDFATLVGAQELVMSNSTFSWWAARASQASQVIAPRPWLERPTHDHLALSAWTTLSKRDGQPVADS